MSKIEMRVHIDCCGCENKLKKAILKLDGVNIVDIDMRMQKVIVTGRLGEEKLLKAIRKKGVRADSWRMPYNAQFHDFNHFLKTQISFNETPNPSTHYCRNGNVVHENCICYDPLPMNKSDVAKLALFNDKNPSGCSIM